MKKKIYYKILLLIIILFGIVASLVLLNLPKNQESSKPEDIINNTKGSECIADNDCVLVGKNGDCGCGCYTHKNVPITTEEGCFCALPTSCKCAEGYCEGIFDNS